MAKIDVMISKMQNAFSTGTTALSGELAHLYNISTAPDEDRALMRMRNEFNILPHTQVTRQADTQSKSPLTGTGASF